MDKIERVARALVDKDCSPLDHDGTPLWVHQIKKAQAAIEAMQDPAEASMHVTITPTPEMDDMKINGVSVPVRIWKGKTTAGASLEVLVLSVIPDTDNDLKIWKTEAPDFMVPSRKVYEIDGRPKDKPDA